MTAKTQLTESSDAYVHHSEVTRGRRLEDELRLRELELQTNFQIRVLSDSLDVLKGEFHTWRDSLNERLLHVAKEVDSLKTRLTVVIALLIGQMAGVPGMLSKVLGGV